MMQASDDCVLSLRTWALMWGAILTFTMSLVPTFRHFRVLNIISLTGKGQKL